ADVRSYSRMHKLFDILRPQVVYHGVAYKHVPLMKHNPFEAIKSDVQGTKNVADLAIKIGTDKYVMVSTDKAVNPTNIMVASKLLAEIYIQALNDSQYSLKQGGLNGSVMYVSKNTKTRFITTRFGNVLGSSGSVLPRFKSQIERGGPLTVTHPEITRYFMTIR